MIHRHAPANDSKSESTHHCTCGGKCPNCPNRFRQENNLPTPQGVDHDHPIDKD